MTTKDWIKKNASTILTCFGAAGMVVTVILAVEATPKALRARTDAQIRKGQNQLTKWEIVKASAPAYIPTAAVGTGSLICIFGANVLSRRQQASMAAAYTALASAFDGYKDKVELVCGPGTDRMIEKTVKQEEKDIDEDRPPWDEIQTFYLGCAERPVFFERTMEQIIRSEFSLNHNFVTRGFVTLNELLEMLDLEPVEDGDLTGWGSCIGENNCGYRWIEFDHSYYVTDNGLSVCSITPLIEPHPLELPF